MIFYFSGTGNSLHAAKAIADAQGERLASIPDELKRSPAPKYELGERELLGFVFPVFAWGPPRIVLDFLGGMDIAGKASYVFSLCTCGEEEGRTTDILRRALARRGLPLDSAFTLRMPNSYVISYDVDPEDEAREKFAVAKKELAEANSVLAGRRKGVFRLIPGSSPGLKSGVVYPLFDRFGRRAEKFYATEDCTRCGLCERICPMGAITVTDKPRWSGECAQCLACLNRCPTKAIQYGKATVGKGRYIHPDLRPGSK